MLQLLTNKSIYDELLRKAIPQAESFLWIATADIKDLHIHKGRRMVPFLSLLADLAHKGIALRLIHAKEPGPRFREDYDKYPILLEALEMMLCPRCHLKTVVIDGATAFTGSANLTGAGMGAKADTTRNFESGILTDQPEIVEPLMQQFDELWSGVHCTACKRKEYCAQYQEMGL